MDIVAMSSTIEDLPASGWQPRGRQPTEEARVVAPKIGAPSSAAYENAVAAASRENLLVAWHAARKVQHACEMGSASWSEARAVSELIRGGVPRKGVAKGPIQSDAR